MFTFFQKLFSPPFFEQDDEKTRSAVLLNPLLIGTIILLSVLTLAQGLTGEKTYISITTAILATLILVSMGLLFLLRKGYVRPAAYVYSSLGWIALTFQAWTDKGFRDTAIIGYFVIILVSGLLIGMRFSLGYLAISSISCWIFAYMETIGKYSGLGDPPYRSAITLTVFFLLVAIISSLAVNDINRALNKSRSSEKELRINNQELQALRVDLEKRVSERTLDLERRTSEIQTASLIARDTAMAPDIESLLDRAVQLIKDKFGYYHTGIYIIDDNGEYAILMAAGGDAGRLMLKRKYKVRVGEMGIIGNVAQTGTSRIVMDVSTAEVSYQKNPLLPYTRSEMAVPLKVTSHIIGVLDIQSDKINAFDYNSISIMQIVTDQISIGIERSQLLQGLQQSTLSLQQALQQNTSRTWKNYLEQNRITEGYRYDGVNIESLSDSTEQNIPKLLAGTKPANIARSSFDSEANVMAVPIRLRGQTLGSLNLKFKKTDISQDTIRLVEEAANRLALALENARLVQDAQRLAMRERQINIISAQTQQSTNLETLLQNTVRELGNTLGLPNTFIQIGLLNSELKKD
jgi:GAF domain-containing protein